MSARRSAIALILSLVALAWLGAQNAPGAAPSPTGGFTSNGQRIYFRSESSSGRPITYRWAFAEHPWAMAYATCHHSDGKGGEVSLAQQQFDAPDITWDDLTKERHPAYTVQTVKGAIVDGTDESGGALDQAMPRWNMAPADLDDLVSFLMTLKEKGE